MSATNVYRLGLSRPHRVLVFGVLTLMSIVGLGMIAAALAGYQNGPPLFVAVLWSTILGWNWHVVLGIPYEIRFESDDQISFVSLVRTETLRVTDLRSIKIYGGGGGIYLLHHRQGKIRVLAQFTGFYEVLSRIKAANPQFETVGI